MYKTAWRIAKLTPILIAIEDCLYGPAFVRGRSMQPTLNPGDGDSNDLVLADKWSIKLYRYRRGDVVLLRYIDHTLRELATFLLFGIYCPCSDAAVTREAHTATGSWLSCCDSSLEHRHRLH